VLSVASMTQDLVLGHTDYIIIDAAQRLVKATGLTARIV